MFLHAARGNAESWNNRASVTPPAKVICQGVYNGRDVPVAGKCVQPIVISALRIATLRVSRGNS
jgi:hypothetical protein